MREIKFRAWDKEIKFMLDWGYGNLISFDGIPYEEAEVKYNTPHIEISKNENLIPMQYTGLKDKAGKEIYEGDILKFIDDETIPDKPTECITNVFWWNEMSRFDLKNTYMKFNFTNNEYFEIIGNIYENSELLKS